MRASLRWSTIESRTTCAQCHHVGTRPRDAIRMKRCGRCKQDKAPDEYGFRDKTTGRRHSVCTSCQRVYRADYVQRVGRQAHHARIGSWITEYRSQRRAAIEAYLRKHPCIRLWRVGPIGSRFRSRTRCEARLDQRHDARPRPWIAYGSRLRSARCAAPTAIVSRQWNEANGGDLDEVNHET